MSDLSFFQEYINNSRILFAKIGTLDTYTNSNEDKKLAKEIDKQQGGSKFNGLGEIENFLVDENDYVYGFVNLHKGNRVEQIHIENIDNSYKKEEEIENCLIIFINDTSNLVGFYKSAIIYRNYQNNKPFGIEKEYCFKTKKENAILLKKPIKIEIRMSDNKKIIGENMISYWNKMNDAKKNRVVEWLKQIISEDDKNDGEIDKELQEEKKYYEGNKEKITIEIKQRNQQIIKQVKERDNYTCQSCNFKFENKIVECHHLTPISEQESNYEIKENDLITLCPTCHKLAHYLLNKNGKNYIDKDILLNELKTIKEV